MRSIPKFTLASYCGAVVPAFAEESQGIASANVVGFQQVGISNGYSFATVTFKNVGASDDKYIDLLDIVPLTADGKPFAAIPKDGTVCSGQIYLWLMKDTAGHYSESAYRYYSSKSGGEVLGWQVGAKTATVKRGDVVLRKGEGVIIQCLLADGAMFQYSGEVEILDTSYNIPNGYAFSGNTTPVARDLLDITPLTADGKPFAAIPKDGTVCSGQIYLWKMKDTAGHYIETPFRYYSSKSSGEVLGWQVGAKTAPATRGMCPLAPGEGFIVQCLLSDGAQLKMKAPLED